MSYTDPCASPPQQLPAPGWGQSLSSGAAGITLLHIAYAHTGIGGWSTVHQWAETMTGDPVVANTDASLFRGAPAVAFALRVANHPGYATALDALDTSIAALTRQRLDRAHERIERGTPPALREFDLINGLTGIGTYLLHDHENGLLRDVLSYLVALTEPLSGQNCGLPGWWTDNGPADQPSRQWPGGHANVGMAHGISGPLALLSIALRCGITVPGHTTAIDRICTWLDQHQSGTPERPWWPDTISRTEHDTGTLSTTGPHRPSWCYGTPGVARAHQLAALATGNLRRAHYAENALAACLTDQTQLAQLTDGSLCHGWAGLVHTTHRMAAHAGLDSPLHTLLPALNARWEQHRHHDLPPGDEGMLEGSAGIALARQSAAAPVLLAARWDTCLLIAPPSCLENTHTEGTR